MDSNPLRDFAETHSAFDGEVTFYMCPFPTFETDYYLIEFQRQHRRTKWVNQKTGEETTVDPYPGPDDDPILKAQREASDWQPVELWTHAHTIFLACMPSTVDIAFADKLSKPAARALQVFWQSRNGNMEHNWDLFRRTIGRDAGYAWFDAYQQTRDDSMDGPDELQGDPDEETDPNAVSSATSSGRNSSATGTKPSRKKS